MKVLVVGSGAREHAICLKLSHSDKVTEIYCVPGNDGISKIAKCANIQVSNIEEICKFAKAYEIDLTVVGPEEPIALGIADLFESENLLIFAPSKKAARIETSKGYAKKFMHKYKIPTAPFKVFDRENQAIDYVKRGQFPVVIKYDGLAHGKGVFVCETFREAKNAITNCFKNQHRHVVIERFITGREISVQVITDGYHCVPLPVARDYKKALDGDGGSNTGGMGAYAPVSFVDEALETKIAQKIIFPAIDGLANDGTPFVGTLYAGIIVDSKNNPWTLEFNARFGDPEAQTVLPLLDEDLFSILYASATGALSDEYDYFKTFQESSVTVVAATTSYPSSSTKGDLIEGLDEFEDDDHIDLYYSGISKDIYGDYVTNGGRILSINSTASTLANAHKYAYDAIQSINYKNKKYRKDIAKDEIYKIENIL